MTKPWSPSAVVSLAPAPGTPAALATSTMPPSTTIGNVVVVGGDVVVVGGSVVEVVEVVDVVVLEVVVGATVEVVEVVDVVAVAAGASELHAASSGATPMAAATTSRLRPTSTTPLSLSRTRAASK